MTEATVVNLRARRRRRTVEPVLLTKAEVADRLGVSPRTVDRWVEQNRVPHLYLGDRSMLRFPVDAIDEWWRRKMEAGQ